MSSKRFWWSVLAVWFVFMATSFVFHGWWMAPLYQETAQFWRPEADMQKWMWVMWFGNLIFSWAFVWIYSKGLSKENPWMQAFRYAWAIILVSQIHQLTTTWSTAPYPWDIIWRWGVIGIIQAMACAFVMTWTYKPQLAWQTQTHK